MRRMIELTAEDFPGTDHAKFEEWKKMRMATDKKIMGAVVILFILSIISIIMLIIRVYGNDIMNFWYVYCLLLIVYMIAILAFSSKTLSLQKSLGITKRSMREAMKK